jgi:hypothetical protein
MNRKGKHRVLVVPDLQLPFAHQDAISFLKWMKKKFSPDVVVNVGDEVDFHALGDWDHDPDGSSAGDELKLALEQLEEHYTLFPNVMVCTSNHTARPFRRAFKYGIPKAFLTDYWEVDGTRYEHGEGQSGPQGALKAALANMQPTVIGHIHSHAGILYSANEKHLIYGFNVGSLIDRHAYAFRYGAKIKSKPILGAGIVDKGVPTYIPMLLDQNGRWTGRKK